MKNERMFLPFALALVFLFAGCINKPNEKDFYGKWQSRRDTGLLTVDISAESWKGQYSEGSSSSYTIEGLTWKPLINKDPVTKEEYPSGYYINGTATQVYKITNLLMGEQKTYEL
jgi:hypothetical protein